MPLLQTELAHKLLIRGSAQKVWNRPKEFFNISKDVGLVISKDVGLVISKDVGLVKCFSV